MIGLSTARLECATPGCADTLRLERETEHSFGVDDIYGTLVIAGTALGWRRNHHTRSVHCPMHAHSAHLACIRCLCRDCSCMRGPQFDAVALDSEGL